MKVGLSVSFCIKDIALGEVDINDVQFISGGTCCKDMEQWQPVIETYRKIYWSHFPDKAEEILRYFLERNLIIQPRLEGMEPVTLLSRPEERGLRYWIDASEYNMLADMSNVRYKV